MKSKRKQFPCLPPLKMRGKMKLVNGRMIYTVPVIVEREIDLTDCTFERIKV